MAACPYLAVDKDNGSDFKIGFELQPDRTIKKIVMRNRTLLYFEVITYLIH